MSKKRIYITSAVLLSAIIVPSIATFAYLNVAIKPGIEISYYGNKPIKAYDSTVKINSKIIRIPENHEIEYRWYSQKKGDTKKELVNFQNQSSIEVKNNAIEPVTYSVDMIDTYDNKTYYSNKIVIDYIQPELYISGNIKNTQNIEMEFNPYIESIQKDTNELTLIANINKDIADNDNKIKGWFIFKKTDPDNNFKIEDLLSNPNSNGATEFNFVNNANFVIEPNSKNILKIKNLQTIKQQLENDFVVKYFWTNTNVEYSKDVQLKFMQ